MSNCRHEYKYRINRIEEDILRIKAEGIMETDFHAAPEGFYHIRSLYFDDIDNSCVDDIESGISLRSKFRLRYYNDDREYIRLEKKSKAYGMTIKESSLLSRCECDTLIKGEIPLIRSDSSRVKREMFLEMQLRGLKPKMIVSYERIPFVYTAGNVRFTFDRNITSSCDTELFLQGNYKVRPIMPPGESILEVKWSEVLPVHIRDVMQLDSLQWTSFSKYYICMKYHL